MLKSGDRLESQKIPDLRLKGFFKLVLTHPYKIKMIFLIGHNSFLYLWLLRLF